MFAGQWKRVKCDSTAQLLKVMNLESSPLADVFERYNTAKLTTVIDEDDEGMEIRRHFVFPDGSHEDQKTSKKFNIESDFDFFDENGPCKVKGIFKRKSQVHINGNEGPITVNYHIDDGRLVEIINNKGYNYKQISERIMKL